MNDINKKKIIVWREPEYTIAKRKHTIIKNLYLFENLVSYLVLSINKKINGHNNFKYCDTHSDK